jgi:hypothetical protein
LQEEAAGDLGDALQKVVEEVEENVFGNLHTEFEAPQENFVEAFEAGGEAEPRNWGDEEEEEEEEEEEGEEEEEEAVVKGKSQNESYLLKY